MLNSKKSGYKIFYSVFGVLLLIAGVGSGILLVTQPQLIDQKAQVVKYFDCGGISPESCSPGEIDGGSRCTDGPSTATSPRYCCPSGQVVIGGVCTRPKDNIITGDASNDGKVNYLDIEAIINNYSKPPQLNLDLDLDINNDNSVDIIDIGIIIDNFKI